MFGRRKKQSFFERLTGAVPADDFDEYEDEYEDEVPQQRKRRGHDNQERTRTHVTSDMEDDEDVQMRHDDEVGHNELLEEEEPVGQLSVDVINTGENIIIRSMLAGIKPGDIDVDISRDMVTIKGTREEVKEEDDEDYFHRELFWGSFSRNILLPEEIDVDAAEANEKHGLLTLKLPKLDKNRKTKVHVKAK